MTLEGKAPIEGPWVDRVNSSEAFSGSGVSDVAVPPQ
jgi:hypothetical protein